MDRFNGFLLSWHPLVIPPNTEISQQLVQKCIEHTAAAGRNRMEVFLMNLTAEYREYARQCGANYLAAGMVHGYEWNYMEADLQQLDFSIREIPDTMRVCPRLDFTRALASRLSKVL